MSLDNVMELADLAEAYQKACADERAVAVRYRAVRVEWEQARDAKEAARAALLDYLAGDSSETASR